MTREKVLASRAQVVADRLLAALGPSCHRAIVAGSLRRGEAVVKDVEIVAEPWVMMDLFGEPTGQCRLGYTIGQMVAEGRLRWRTETHPTIPDVKASRRVWSLVALPEGVAVDLFAVRPPAQWGAIVAIRTGPSDYSRNLVTVCQQRGLRCQDGRLVDGKGHTVPTPEEADFLRECGVPWAEPRDRK